MEGGKLRHRVLIVEDEDNIALALDYVLTREGYDHERIANGAEALPKIRDTAPDLVLLDAEEEARNALIGRVRANADSVVASYALLAATGALTLEAATGQTN